jgi:hypothetical protein
MQVVTPKVQLFLRYFLLTGNRLTFALAGTAVGTGTLATHRQTLTMTQSTVAGDIQQTLDIHLYFRTKGAFDLELIRNGITDGIQLIVIPLIHLLVQVNTRRSQDILSGSTANTVDIGKSDLPSFIFW